MVRAALTIAANDLRQRLRDRSAIVLGFIAPVLIAGLMSAAFSGTDTFHIDVGLVDADRGRVAVAFSTMLADPGLADLLTVTTFDSAASARSAVDAGEIQAAFVVPAGFTDDVVAGRPARIRTLTDIDARIAGQVAVSIATSFTTQVNGQRLTLATVALAGLDPTDAGVQATVAELAPAERLATTSSSGRPLKDVSYFGPGMAIFFLLFAVGFTARSYFTDQRSGMIDRVHAAPVGPFTVVLGKSLSVIVFGSASLLAMGLVTTLAFGAYWGPAPAALGLGAAVIGSVTALAALVISVAGTERQADGWSSIITFGLALLGGNFLFLPAAPAIMRKLALLTPNGWAMRGYTDLATGGGAGSAVVPVLSIVTFTVVVGGIAAALTHRAAQR